MSTICKLDSEVRRRRTARANLLRNPPPIKTGEAVAIISELALIHVNPRLSGSVKHMLFERGATQLSKL